MAAHSFKTFPTPGAYLKATRSSYIKREVENSLPFGIALRADKQEKPDDPEKSFFALVSRSGRPLLGLSQSPGRNLLLSQFRGKAAVDLEDTLDWLEQSGLRPPGLGGPLPLVEQFAAAWETKTGGKARLHRRERIFKLTRVIPPHQTPGYLRPVEEGDLPQLLIWAEDYSREALGKPGGDEMRRWILDRASRGALFVWVHGTIVSMCMQTRPTEQGISISLVYTPPALRRKGYASVMVAALSLRLLREGWAYVSLFTDLANPTSNHIYQTVGFQPVCDWNEYTLERGQA